MLDHASTITATVSPYDAELLLEQHQQDQHMTMSMFSTTTSYLATNIQELKGNLTQPLATSYEKFNSASTISSSVISVTSSSSDLYPMVNVASTFMLDWCNQSMLNSEQENNNIALSNGFNCSHLTNANNWNSTGNATFIDISFILPWWRQVLWSILFGGMVIVATGGNLIVVWIVMTTKRMRTVTNYFIVNLSIADAMVSSLNVTFNYIYMLDQNWPFGQLYCKISQFIATLSISASVFTLMAISIDRYVAIMKPLKPRMSKRSNLAIAAAIWLTSAVISCPMLLFFTTDNVTSTDGIRTVCYSEWPDGLTNHSTQEYIYNILFMILTYFMPIISMTATYSLVGLELWGSKAIGEYTPRQVENVKSKRRVVKMMMVVVLIFAVCWLPFHAYFIVTACYPELTEATFIQELYLFIYWLAMSNSMYNPIIYCWMNSRFRFGFKMFFRWCPFVHIGAESLNRRDNMTSRYSCSGSPDHNRIKRNDTQRSFLYTCPGSPKGRRISHCGVVRSSMILNSHRDSSRHSAPQTSTSTMGSNYLQEQHNHHHSTPQRHHHHHHPQQQNTSLYHQHCSQKMPGIDANNSHELTSLNALGIGCNGPSIYTNSKDILLKTSTARNSGKWSTNAGITSTTTPTTKHNLEVSCSSAFNGVNDKNYLANRQGIMS